MFRVLMPVVQSVERAMAQAKFVANLPSAPEAVKVLLLHVIQESDPDDLPPGL